MVENSECGLSLMCCSGKPGRPKKDDKTPSEGQQEVWPFYLSSYDGYILIRLFVCSPEPSLSSRAGVCRSTRRLSWGRRRLLLRRRVRCWLMRVTVPVPVPVRLQALRGCFSSISCVKCQGSAWMGWMVWIFYSILEFIISKSNLVYC